MSKIPDEVLRAFTPCWAKVYVQTSPADAYLIPARSADELALRGEVMGCSLGEMAADLLACREALRGLMRGQIDLRTYPPEPFSQAFDLAGPVAFTAINVTDDTLRAARACLPEYDV